VCSLDDITYGVATTVPSFIAGGSLTLTSTITPLNATDKVVTYTIIRAETTAAGAQIIDNIVTATGVGVIAIRLSAGEFEGPILYIKVKK